MPFTPTGEAGPLEKVGGIIIENATRVAALELLIILVLRNINEQTDADISGTLAGIRQALMANPDASGSTGKEILAVIERYEALERDSST